MVEQNNLFQIIWSLCLKYWLTRQMFKFRKRQELSWNLTDQDIFRGFCVVDHTNSILKKMYTINSVINENLIPSPVSSFSLWFLKLQKAARRFPSASLHKIRFRHPANHPKLTSFQSANAWFYPNDVLSNRFCTLSFWSFAFFFYTRPGHHYSSLLLWFGGACFIGNLFVVPSCLPLSRVEGDETRFRKVTDSFFLKMYVLDDEEILVAG